MPLPILLDERKQKFGVSFFKHPNLRMLIKFVSKHIYCFQLKLLKLTSRLI